MAVTLIQSAKRSGSGTTETHTWGTPPTPGNLIIVVGVGWVSASPPTMSVTDNAGTPNTYTQRSTNALVSTRCSIFSAVVGQVPTTTTLTFSASSDHSITFCEFASSGASFAFDVEANATNASTTAGAQTCTAGPTATLAQAAELVITGYGAATGNSSSGISAPATYTGLQFEQNSPSFIGMGSAYKEVASTTGVSVTWGCTFVSGDAQIATIATFKLASSSDTALTPAQSAVTLTGLAPTLARTANQAVSPAVDSVVLTGFAPTCSRRTERRSLRLRRQ